MVKKVTGFYKRITYLNFRLFYTFTHLIAFLIMKDQRKSTDVTDNTYILLCGIEPQNCYSLEKILKIADLCKKKFPDKKIILLSKLEGLQEFSNQLPIEIVPWDYQTRARLLFPLYKLFYKKAVFDETKIKEFALNAALMIDLGEYQLDSGKGTGWTANMLSNIVFAKRFSLPFYIFPQSVSPFSYPFPVSIILKQMLKKIPSYAADICIREDWGIEAFNKASHGNVKRCLDFLLYYVEEEHILRNYGEKINSLVLIPDLVLIRKKELFLQILKNLETGLSNSFSELIIYPHDKDEEKEIELIKNIIPERWKIQSTGGSLRNKNIFDTRKDAIVISSNYHALIHCIHAETPAIALAVNRSISSLYEDFSLAQYMLNYDDFTNMGKISSCIDMLIKNRAVTAENNSMQRKKLQKEYPLPIFC